MAISVLEDDQVQQAVQGPEEVEVQRVQLFLVDKQVHLI
jgi:hypothetical protein